MNKAYLVLSILLVMFLTGCNNIEEINSDASSEEANAIAFEHLIIKDGVYALNLSEEMVQELGISPTDYQRIKRDVAESSSRWRDLYSHFEGI